MAIFGTSMKNVGKSSWESAWNHSWCAIFMKKKSVTAEINVKN